MIVLIWNNIVFAQIEIPTFKIENEQDLWELYIEDKISWDDYRTLSYLYQHPLDVNSAEVSQLQELPNVDFDLAQKIYNNRVYKNTQELIPLIGKDLYEQIKVFIKVKQVWKRELELWLTDTQDDNKKADLKTRLCFSTQEMEVSSLVEREELKKRYLMLVRPHSKVVIGNYQARFGEGITFNTAHRKSYRGVVADDGTRKSNNQDGFLIETTFDNKLKATVFYSWVDLDKFPNAVLSEFDSKEKLWGGNLNLIKGDNSIGITGYVSNFIPDEGENKRIEILGIDFLKRGNMAEIAGEIARSKNQGNGVSIRGYKKIGNFKYYLSLRRYEQDFVNPHSQVKTGDEQGGSAKISFDSNGLTLKVSGDYHQHFSTLITDEKYWSSLHYKLSPKAKITTKIEYEDKDVSRTGDKKKVYFFELNAKPHLLGKPVKFDITSGYKSTNKDGDISDYAYSKIIYYFKPQITLTVRFKYGPNGNSETYGQVKIKVDQKELIAKYTYTPDALHPHKFYSKMSLKW